MNAEKFINNDCFISVGSTRNIKNQRTYGGMKNLNYKIRIFKNKVVKPNSKYQNINRFNGNIVLISKKAQKKIGFINDNLIHTYGDIDYGISASKLSIPIILCPGFHGICISEKKNIYLKDFFLQKKIFKTAFFFSYKNGGFLWLLHFFSLLYNDFFKFFLIKLFKFK